MANDLVAGASVRGAALHVNSHAGDSGSELLNLHLIPRRDHDFRPAIIETDGAGDVHGLAREVAYIAHGSHVARENNSRESVVRVGPAHINEGSGAGSRGMNFVHRAFYRDSLSNVGGSLFGWDSSGACRMRRTCGGGDHQEGTESQSRNSHGVTYLNAVLRIEASRTPAR